MGKTKTTEAGMNHGSLFSGIGGFDLAAKWCGWTNVFQVEIDKYCQRLLSLRFPNTQRFTDIKEFDGTQFRGQIDVISGGFPCQPFSHAGKRKGKNDDRYLWPEMLRVIKEIQPTWVIGENVAGFVNMGLDESIADLESEGYEVQTFIIPACAVNAPHRRDRVWFVANRRCERQAVEEQQTTGCEQCDSNAPDTNTTGQPNRNGECWGERTPKGTRFSSSSGYDFLQGEWNKNWLEVATCFCGVDDGLPAEVDGLKLSKPRHRMERLKGLGNAIVPQVVYEIFKAITILSQNHRGRNENI